MEDRKIESKLDDEQLEEVSGGVKLGKTSAVREKAETEDKLLRKSFNPGRIEEPINVVVKGRRG